MLGSADLSSHSHCPRVSAVKLGMVGNLRTPMNHVSGIGSGRTLYGCRGGDLVCAGVSHVNEELSQL